MICRVTLKTRIEGQRPVWSAEGDRENCIKKELECGPVCGTVLKDRSSKRCFKVLERA